MVLAAFQAEQNKYLFQYLNELRPYLTKQLVYSAKEGEPADIVRGKLLMLDMITEIPEIIKQRQKWITINRDIVDRIDKESNN